MANHALDDKDEFDNEAQVRASVDLLYTWRSIARQTFASSECGNSQLRRQLFTHSCKWVKRALLKNHAPLDRAISLVSGKDLL